MSSLAAARADNFYYAPDFDPKKHKSLNKYNGQHPLRERAAKLDQGILVIRFEVPFNIWCDKCGEHIAKGERFNAEKKAIGNYHSTKILQFSMTHHCGCTICIQTDPKNAEYIVVEGARKKVETYSAKAAGVMELPDEAEKERRDKDPLYRLEYQQGAKAKALTGAARVAAIHDMADDRAADPYALNKALRASLRADKRAAAVADAERRALGLHESVRLLPASEGDAIAAQTAFLTSSARAEAGAEAKRKRILEQDIFSSGRGGDGSSTAAGIVPTPGGAHKAGIRSVSQAGASTAAPSTCAAAMTRPQQAVPAGGSRREHDADGPPPAKRQAVSWAAVVATAAPSRLHASSSSEPGAAAPAVSATAVAPAARSGGASPPSGRVGGGETGINMGSETAVVTGPSSVAARSLGGRQEPAGRSAAAEALASSYTAVAARGVSGSGPGTGAGTGAGPCAMSGSSRRSTGGGGASSAGGGAGGSGGVVGASRAVTANQGAVGGAAAAGSSRPPPGAGALAAAAQAAALRKLHGGRAASSHHTAAAAAAAAAGARPHSAGALGAGAAAGASGGFLKRTLKDRAAELQQRRGGGGAGLGFSAPRAPM